MTFVMVIMMFVIMLTYAPRYRRVPPLKVMIVFGRRHGGRGFTVVKGDGKFIMPILEEVAFLPLDVHTLDVTAEGVMTLHGVMLDLEAVTQITISSDEKLLLTAAEMLLNKSAEEINYIATRSLEGHIRAVCARLTVEEINADRNKVAAEIQDVACEDLASMGIEVVSFTIRNLDDRVGYLNALGKKQTAEVIRNAVIGEAEAGRDATIRAASAREDAIKNEAMAMSRAWRFGETYATLGTSIRVLARTLEDLNQQFGRDNRDIMTILEESGMSEEELSVIHELLRTPGKKGDLEFQEKVKEMQETLGTWRQEEEKADP